MTGPTNPTSTDQTISYSVFDDNTVNKAPTISSFNIDLQIVTKSTITDFQGSHSETVFQKQREISYKNHCKDMTFDTANSPIITITHLAGDTTQQTTDLTSHIDAISALPSSEIATSVNYCSQAREYSLVDNSLIQDGVFTQ